MHMEYQLMSVYAARGQVCKVLSSLAWNSALGKLFVFKNQHMFQFLWNWGYTFSSWETQDLNKHGCPFWTLLFTLLLHIYSFISFKHGQFTALQVKQAYNKN